MVVSNIYRYKDKDYVVTDVVIKTYESAMRTVSHEVYQIELSCIDKDERGKTGKKIYLDPLTFYRCTNAGGTVWKIGEEE